MIPVKEALNIILKNLPEKKVITKPLLESAGYVLAEDIRSDIDLPPFDKSAMDGFAVKHTDIKKIPATLELIDTVAAGSKSNKAVSNGKTIKIMTGAPVPKGADTVVMKELTQEQGHRVSFLAQTEQNANICYKGEDLKKGDKVLAKGSLIGPAQISVLATVGKASLKVFHKPSIAILTTGDELVEVNKKPRGAQIRNSNSYLLMAQIKQFGLKPENLGIARDTIQNLTAKIKQGLKRDILIITGGVSAGDYDIVEPVLKKLGVKLLFDTVAIKPGKPFVFGIRNNNSKSAIRNPQSIIFALPGNPVSSFVITEIFIHEAIARITDNHSLKPRYTYAKLAKGKINKHERQQYIPAIYDEQKDTVLPVTWHGSADVIGLSKANSLIIVPRNSNPVSHGDSVQICLI